MTTIFTCASCGERIIEPVVVNGIRMCEMCADALPRAGRREGLRQPRLDRKRLAREDRVRDTRGW